MCAVVREDSGTFCFPSYGHSNKIPRQVFGAATLSNGAATLGGRTATCGSRAASRYATREVVASEHDLEVVGDEGAHEAVGVADFVLRLLLEDIKKHYKGAVLPGRPKKAQKIRSQTKKNINLRKY